MTSIPAFLARRTMSIQFILPPLRKRLLPILTPEFSVCRT